MIDFPSPVRELLRKTKQGTMRTSAAIGARPLCAAPLALAEHTQQGQRRRIAREKRVGLRHMQLEELNASSPSRVVKARAAACAVRPNVRRGCVPRRAMRWRTTEAPPTRCAASSLAIVSCRCSVCRCTRQRARRYVVRRPLKAISALTACTEAVRQAALCVEVCARAQACL